MAVNSSMLATRWGEFADLAHFSEQSLQDGRFCVDIDDGKFECLFSSGKERRLFILLGGARDPATKSLPKFDRWSWYSMFPGSVLCISDPTLLLKPEEMHIGWYVGTARHDWMKAMAALVRTIAARLDIDEDAIVCYGSSAGGFAAMMLAAELKRATAVAINPQTDVCRYSARFVKQLLDEAFDGRTQAELTAQESQRLSAIDALRQAPDAKCLIVQNRLDHQHYERHYLPFCDALGVSPDGGHCESGRIVSLMFEDPNGHGPEPRELAPELIARSVTMAAPDGMNAWQEWQDRFEVPATRTTPRINTSQLYLVPMNTAAAKPAVEASFAYVAAGRADLPPFELRYPIDWNIDPFTDRNWSAQMHMWRMMDAHLVKHGKTSQPEWLEFPLRVIEDWHRFHYIERRTSKYAWKDMMVGLRAMKIAYVISHMWQDSGEIPAKWQRIFNEIVPDHIRFLTDHKNVAYSNHTFIDVHGAAALAQVVRAGGTFEINRFIDVVLEKLIASQFDRHGVHREHSPGYQPFGIGCIKRLQNSLWFERFEFGELIAKAEEVSEWFLLPDGRKIPFGDTDGARQQAEVAETVFKGRRQVFNSSGYAIVRDDGGGKVGKASLLAVMGAFNSKFHKQSDDLSLVWFEGEDILCDAGKFAYKTDPRSTYVQSARAHNTVEIDGQNYGAGRAANPKCVYGSAIGAIAVHEWGYLVDARVQHLEIGVTHSRFIAFNPGQWLLVIDRLSSEMPREFTQWFHFSPHLPDLVKQDGTYVTRLSSGRKLRICSAGSNPVSDHLEKGTTSPRLQGWISQAYGELVPNCALGFGQGGPGAMFATLFCLDDTGSSLVCQDEKRLNLKISRNGKVDSFRILVGDTTCQVRHI